jgi:uncharacterized protein involved in response to NO
MDQTSPRPNVKSLFSYGFRPFFLLAGLSSSLFLLAWLKVFNYGGVPSKYFPPLLWHPHEMMFGFAAAMIAGFLLTAVPNWTGEKARTGTELMVLVSLWLAARVAILVTPSLIATVLDLAFFPALFISIGLPLIRSRKPNVLIFLPILLVLWLGNLLMHLQALKVQNTAQLGISISLSLIILLIVIIGGRVIPFFTLRALQTEPKKWAVLDYLAPITILLVPVVDHVPPTFVVGWSIVSLVIHGVRIWGWHDRRIWGEPLLWVLYLGYAWIPIGIVTKGAAAVGWVSASVAVHAFTVGAIGVVGLGMMARVCLGHTGRPLKAAKLTVLAFLLMEAAAILRVFGPVFLTEYPHYLSLSGGLWSLAFLIFVGVYMPILTTPRPDGKP